MIITRNNLINIFKKQQKNTLQQTYLVKWKLYLWDWYELGMPAILTLVNHYTGVRPL